MTSSHQPRASHQRYSRGTNATLGPGPGITVLQSYLQMGILDYSFAVLIALDGQVSRVLICTLPRQEIQHLVVAYRMRGSDNP